MKVKLVTIKFSGIDGGAKEKHLSGLAIDFFTDKKMPCKFFVISGDKSFTELRVEKLFAKYGFSVLELDCSDIKYSYEVKNG